MGVVLWLLRKQKENRNYRRKIIEYLKLLGKDDKNLNNLINNINTFY